jgi:hypothetical protein
MPVRRVEKGVFRKESGKSPVVSFQEVQRARRSIKSISRRQKEIEVTILLREREDRLANRLHEMYGLSMREYNRMVKEREGKCEICWKNPRRLVVDHCHDTGLVRGLVCDNCNSLLGFARDNISILESAILYLQETERMNLPAQRRLLPLRIRRGL